MAFGGVETGRLIAKEALRATAITANWDEDAEIVAAIATTIGRVILVAAVLLIKFDTKTTKYENINAIQNRESPSVSISVANHASNPLFEMAKPRLSPPMIKIITSHRILQISSASIIPKRVRPIIGRKDMAVVGI